MGGFEPPALRLTAARSATKLHGHTKEKVKRVF